MVLRAPSMKILFSLQWARGDYRGGCFGYIAPSWRSIADSILFCSVHQGSANKRFLADVAHVAKHLREQQFEDSYLCTLKFTVLLIAGWNQFQVDCATLASNFKAKFCPGMSQFYVCRTFANLSLYAAVKQSADGNCVKQLAYNCVIFLWGVPFLKQLET